MEAVKEVVGMVRCPVCESARVVVVLSPTRRAFCVRCGSRWIQEGSVQRGIAYSRERDRELRRTGSSP